MSIALCVLLATIGTSKVGVFFTPPEWMPERVKPRYIPGSGEQYVSNRVSAYHAGGFLTTADAALERWFFMCTPNAPTVYTEAGLRSVDFYVHNEYGYHTNRNLSGWSPRITVAYTNIVRDCADKVLNKILGCEGESKSFFNKYNDSIILSSSLLTADSPALGVWVSNPVDAHANLMTYFPRIQDVQFSSYPWRWENLDNVSKYYSIRPLYQKGIEWYDELVIGTKKSMYDVFWNNAAIYYRLRSPAMEWERLSELVTEDYSIPEYPAFTTRITPAGYDFRNAVLAALDTTYSEIDFEYEVTSDSAEYTASKLMLSNGTSHVTAPTNGRCRVVSSGHFEDYSKMEKRVDAVQTYSHYGIIAHPAPEYEYGGLMEGLKDLYITEQQAIDMSIVEDPITSFTIAFLEDGAYLYSERGYFEKVLDADECYQFSNVYGGAYGKSRISGVEWVSGITVGGTANCSGGYITIPSRFGRNSGRASPTAIYGAMEVVALRNNSEYNVAASLFNISERVPSGNLEGDATDLAWAAVEKLDRVVDQHSGYNGTNAAGVIRGMLNPARISQDAQSMLNIEAQFGATWKDKEPYVMHGSPTGNLVRVFSALDGKNYVEIEKDANGRYHIGMFGFQFTTNFSRGEPYSHPYTNVNGQVSCESWVKTKWRFKSLPLR